MQTMHYGLEKQKAIPDLLLFNIYEIAYAINTMGGHQDSKSVVVSKKVDKKREQSTPREKSHGYVSAIGLINYWPFLSGA